MTVPNLPYSSEEKSDKNNLPKLSYLAFQALPKIPQKLRNFFEKELWIQSYYNCNGCSNKIPGESCITKTITLYKEDKQASANYNFCYKCSNKYE